MRWPIMIAAGLGLVVAVNMAFIYVAVSGADTISADYKIEANRR